MPYMGKLLHEVGHAVFLGVIWRSTELNLFRISEIDMPIFGVSASYSSPIPGSSIAKVILAFQPEEKVLEIYKNADVRAYTDRTITSLDVYLKEMEKVRMAGYGINDEEIHPGIRSLAGPIRRFDAEVIAGLSVGGYIPMEDLLRLAPKILDYCRMISFSLGYNAESMPKV